MDNKEFTYARQRNVLYPELLNSVFFEHFLILHLTLNPYWMATLLRYCAGCWAIVVKGDGLILSSEKKYTKHSVT